MTKEEQQAIINIRNQLAQCFNEALKTYGPAAAMSGTAIFAASAVHQAEHLFDNPQARKIVLGQWTEHFHAALVLCNDECDDQRDFMRQPPEGLA